MYININKVNNFFKFIFYISVLFLIIISLYPGSLFGYLLYGDFSKQPQLVDNPYGASLNHFIFYFYISILGFIIYLKNENFNNIIYGLLFLSIILEVIHFIIPNRSFQISDLFGNILGVTVAYFAVKIYLFIKKP